MTAMHGGHVRGPLFLPIARDGGGSGMLSRKNLKAIREMLFNNVTTQ